MLTSAKNLMWTGCGRPRREPTYHSTGDDLGGLGRSTCTPQDEGNQAKADDGGGNIASRLLFALFIICTTFP